MKTKLIGLFIAAFLCTTQLQLLAQCDVLLNGNSAPYVMCSEQLPASLSTDDAGGSFSGLGVLEELDGTYTFNPLIGVPGTFDVDVTCPDGTTSTITIQVDAASQVAEIDDPSSPFLCENSEAISLTGNLGDDGVFIINATEITNVVDPAVLGIGAHSVIYTYLDPVTSCYSTDEIIMNVMALPDMTVPELESGNFCLNTSPVLLTAAGTVTGPGITGTNTFDPALAGLGNHTLMHAFSDFPGICVDTVYYDVLVSGILILDFEGQDACFGTADTISYNGDVLGDDAIYEWSVEGGTIVSDLGSSIVVDWEEAGTHPVTLSVLNVDCPTLPVTKDIEVKTAGVTTIEDVGVQLGDQVVLTTVGSEEDMTYSWDPIDGLSCADCQAPFASPIETTTYTVTGTTIEGCTATDEVTVSVVSDRAVFVANVFTPNYDGTNDQLMVQGKGISTIDFTIFDRNGSQLFRSVDMATGWDGTYRGKAANSGVYVWFLKVNYYDGATDELRGNVTLIR